MEFRFRALRQARDPNNLDTTVNLASPRSWIALWVTLFVVVAALAWSFVGSIPQSVSGSGVLTRSDGVIRLQAGVAGIVTAETVGAQSSVTAGEAVATITDTAGGTHVLTAPAAGTVLQADFPPGTAVQPTDQVVVLQHVDPVGTLIAAVVVPTAATTRVHPGLEVSLAVDVVPASQYGLLRGVVSSVNPVPATAQSLASMFLDQPTATRLLSAGSMALVQITLEPDPATTSGYAWTSVSGPPYPLRFQDVVTATVHLPSQAPISYLLGGSA